MTPREPEQPTRSKHREGLTSYEMTKGRRRLADMVDQAFATLEEASRLADHATSIKAATAILDRAGFGPRSTVDVNTTSVDLSSLSREELVARASRVHQLLLEARNKELPTIDGVVVSKTVQ